MNLLLKKALHFNHSHPFLLFWGSTLCLIGSIIFTLNCLEDFKQTAEAIKVYEKLFKASAPLQKAARLLHPSIEPHAYLQSTLEPTTLLVDLQHRHEQSLYPSVPLDLNPHGNCLKHTMTPLSSKGLKRICYELKKPVLADEEDLKQLFTLIEHRSIFPYKTSLEAPYLFFTHFQIHKHCLSSYEKVFQISYRLESVSL